MDLLQQPQRLLIVLSLEVIGFKTVGLGTQYANHSGHRLDSGPPGSST
jgi:hypothetical protein